MGLYGAKELEVSKFAGGLVTDVAATEIQENQTPDCQNVDLRDESVSVRRGRTPFNGSPPEAHPVRGLHAWYSPAGARKLLMQAGTGLYEENGTGTFALKVTLPVGGTPGDFCQYKLDTYWGNGADPVYKRAGADGAWSQVQLLATPTAGPAAAIVSTVAESFDSTVTHGSDPTQGWVLVGSANSSLRGGSAVDVAKLEGTECLNFRQTNNDCKGTYVHKCWSAATRAQTTITSSINSSVTTVPVASATGMSAGDYLLVDSEQMLITGISGTTLTVTRAQNGTAAASHSNGATASVQQTRTSLNGAITSAATSLTVNSAAGMGVGDYLQVEAEVMLITAISGNTLTVTRAQGGTLAASHADKVAATVAKLDLSGYSTLVLWYQCSVAGAAFSVAIKDNSGYADFSRFPVFTTQSPGTWIPLRIPLSGIAPAARTASLGVAIQYLSKPPKYAFSSGNIDLFFDLAVPEVGFDADTYEYSATWATVTSTTGIDVVAAESNPSAVVTVDVKDLPTVSGIALSPLSGAPSGANAMLFYRHRPLGPFRLPRLIGSAPAGTTLLANGSGIKSTDATLTLANPTGYVPFASGAVGAVLAIDAEHLLVTAVDTSAAATGGAVQFTVSRGFDGTTPAAHANGATVSFVKFLDQVPDGTLVLLDTPEQESGKIPPPLAGCYAVANGRLLAGNVNVDGTAYPYRLYLSRAFYPDEFATQQNPGESFAAAAGWVDIPTKDTIRRILEFDGMSILFCDRSVWSLEGSGWDDFSLRKRSDYGLVAREAVVVAERQIYYYAEDGIRILSPNRQFDNLFSSWLMSEPVASRLASIPPAYRQNTAMGVDDRGRIHVSYTGPGQTQNDRALVFDPNLKDSMEFSAFSGGVVPEHFYNMKRPGWHFYSNWGFSVFTRLKTGTAGDAGQLLGGDVATAVVHFLQQDGSGNDLSADAGAAIPWYWRTRDLEAGPGHRAYLVYARPLFAATAGGSTTLNQGGTLSSGGTSVTVTSAAPFAVNDYAQIDAETVRITAISGTVLTISRGQLGSVSASHADGTAITKVFAFTITPLLNNVAGGNAKTLSLGTATSGYADPGCRFGAQDQARRVGLQVSGSHTSPIKMQGLFYGVAVRR